MGQDCRPNQAISIELMHEAISKSEVRARRATVAVDRHRWILSGGYFCICFVLSLRSPEGLTADLEGLIKFHDEDREEVVIPLLGRFKGQEHHSKQHLLTSRGTMGSGIQVKQWVRRILAVHRVHGRTSGPAFVNEDGYQSSTADMNEMFLQLLVEIFDENPKLFGLDIKDASDLSDKFNVFRSL